MLRFAYTSIGVKLRYRNESKMITVTAPDWDLLQLIRQLQLSINSADHIKNNQMVDWVLRDVDRSSLQGPSFTECSIYIVILRTFMNYVSDNYDTLKFAPQEVSNLINTSIIVENNKVTISYADPILLKEMQNRIDQEGYKIKINQE